MNTRFDLASTSPRWTCTGNCESTTALLLRSPAAVGLILTAKAITRYPEFKSARFAEYVLIGTLLSVSMAFVAAVFLAWLVFGTARLSG